MKRIPQLDSVRAIAILAVFMHHALGVKLMWTGVDLFFILSGFLITNVLLEAKHHSLAGYFAHFYIRRARRILAPYLLTLIVVSLFVGIAWLHYWYYYVLLTNFILPLHIPHPKAFNALWSLAVEEQFYLVWPFAVYFLNERRLRYFSILLIALAPLLRGVLHFQQDWPIYTLTPFRMDLLATGALLCLVWRQKPEWIRRRGPQIGFPLMALGLATLALLGHFGVITYGNTRVGNVLIYEASLVLYLGFMLYALSGWRVGWLRARWLRYIGTISYTMYLIHLGVITLLGAWLKGVPLALAALLMTVIYASLSWFLMEKRLLQAGSRAKSAKLVAQPQETAAS
jgi:peptidoglycan/LPS O-acetylase OafA/YrhL